MDSITPKILMPSCPGTKRTISVTGEISHTGGAVGFVALTQIYRVGNNAGFIRADEVGGGTGANWQLLATVLCATVQ